MKIYDIPKSGKRGNTVWQRNRYCQYSYPAFIPYNPRSPAQIAVRGTFAAVSKRWRSLTQAQRDVWIAVAWTKWSKPRLLQRGRLTGCQLFVKTNVALVNQGKPQVDLPTVGRSKKEECRKSPQEPIPGLLDEVFVSKQDTGRGETRLILVRVQAETNNPRPCTNAPHPVLVRSQPWQARFQGSHHPGHV